MHKDFSIILSNDTARCKTFFIRIKTLQMRCNKTEVVELFESFLTVNNHLKTEE